MEKQSDLILLDLFSGIGGFHKGLLDAGFSFKETYYSEIDKHAIANYKYNYPHAKHIGSVENILSSGITRPNIITFGSPCFVKGTKVLSTRGFVDISEIVENDAVLSHKGRWCKVTQTDVREHNGWMHTIRLGKDTESILCTPEHPFYVVDKTTVYNSKNRNFDVFWSKPYWIEAKDLTSKHHVVVAKQKESYIPDITEEEAYLFGYYLAEGWVDKTLRKRDGKPMYRILFAMHENAEQHFRDLMRRVPYRGSFSNKKKIAVCVSDKYEGKAIKAAISNQRLYHLFRLAGTTSKTKKIPGFILSAPANIQKKFLEGYMYGDGSHNKKAKSYTATSKNIEMAYGLRHLVRMVYDELATIFYTKVKPTTVINGRLVNQNPYYSIRWVVDKDRKVFSYNVNNEIVVKVISNERKQAVESVYNFTVERDNTYTVGNYVVHNCQDFSLAGKRAGLDGARSGLITQAIAAISHFRPDLFIWENVKGTFSSNHREDFWAIIQAFANIGVYEFEWQLVNTSWLLPQNRERIYLVGHLATSFRNWKRIFPIGENDRLISEPPKADENGIQTQNCGAILSRYGGRPTDTYVKTNSINVAGKICNSLDGIVVHDNGLCPTVNAEHGNTPEILQSGHGFVADSINAVCPTIRANSFEHNTAVIQVNPSKESGGKQPFQHNRMYDTRGISPCLDVDARSPIIKAVLTPNRTEKRQNGRRMKEEGEPSFTLTSQDQHGVAIDKQIRRLTEIECERLQGYPDNWTQFGNYDDQIKVIPKTQRYKLIGNAVTATMVTLLGKRLIVNFRPACAVVQ